MPKQILEINPFHGGLNNNGDPRDIKVEELSQAQDIMIDEIGKVRTMGSNVQHYNYTNSADNPNNVAVINDGYGLFYFSHDRTEGESVGDASPETGDDYLAMADTDTDGNIDIYSRVTNTWGTGKITLGSTTGMKPCFYAVDGALRVSDGNFGSGNTNQWYGYVYSKLFQTTGGTAELTVDKWVSTDQELKAFDDGTGGDLGITLILDDCSDENPAAAQLVENQITLGYWTEDNGTWSGQYFFGVSPIYVGNQEGPVTSSSSSISLNNNILYLQLFIGHPDVDNAAISTHPLGDDRIIGIKIYSRQYTSENWYLIKEVDLKEGGKFGWAEYNSGETASGYLAGTAGVDGTDNDIYARFHTTALTMDVGGSTTASDYKSYERATAQLRVDIGTAALASGRKGVVRVGGFNNSPVYAEIALDNATEQTITIPGVVLPAAAADPGATFTFEILDEQYSVLHEQNDLLIIIAGGAAVDDTSEGGGTSGGGGGGGGAGS